MKKLLMKLFPSYFHVCKHINVDFANFPKPDSPLKLVQVDEDNEDTLRVLGMTPEREEFLEKEVKKAIIDNTCKIAVLDQMTPHLKHLNEFYIVVLLIQRETHMMSNPIGGLIQEMMQRRRDDESPDGEQD